MRSPWILSAAASLLVACGGATSSPPAKAPASPAASAPAAPSVADAKAPTPAPMGKAAKDGADEGLPEGVVKIRARDANDRVPVRPARLDVGALPLAELPDPLDASKAPQELPTGRKPKHIKIEKIDSGWRARGANGSAVYVVLEHKLGRIQIGTIDANRNATDRVYRTCGDRYYAKPMLTPARWQSLTRDGDKAKLTVVDAWFDAQSCEATIVHETVVEPTPLLANTLYAFRRSCEECGPDGKVVFIAPPLSQVAANGLGGDATVSHGAFTVVELPLRRGGAASFTGNVGSHQMKNWVETLRLGTPDGGIEGLGNGDFVLGAELQQGVRDAAPIAITYATLLAH